MVGKVKNITSYRLQPGLLRAAAAARRRTTARTTQQISASASGAVSTFCSLAALVVVAVHAVGSLSSAAMTVPFRIQPNTSIVALRFHKVASTTFKTILAADLQPSYMDHESLAAYRRGGLAEMRCLGAPAAARVVFVTLFREPASRILSAMHFYATFTGYTSQIIRHGSLVNQLRAAQTWVHTTPCSNYTAADVLRVITVLSHAPVGESLGAGMLVSEYSHCTETDSTPLLSHLCTFH